MPKTLWTVTAAGLLALCTTGCGGDSDYASKICDKAKSCGSTTDVATCKAQTNQLLSQIPSAQRDSVDKALDKCLAMTDCNAAKTCFQSAVSTAGGTGGTGGGAAPSTY